MVASGVLLVQLTLEATSAKSHSEFYGVFDVLYWYFGALTVLLCINVPPMCLLVSQCFMVPIVASGVLGASFSAPGVLCASGVIFQCPWCPSCL